jgi:hypothetical protein
LPCRNRSSTVRKVTATMIALSDIVTLLEEIKELLLDEEEEEDGG